MIIYIGALCVFLVWVPPLLYFISQVHKTTTIQYIVFSFAQWGNSSKNAIRMVFSSWLDFQQICLCDMMLDKDQGIRHDELIRQNLTQTQYILR